MISCQSEPVPSRYTSDRSSLKTKSNLNTVSTGSPRRCIRPQSSNVKANLVADAKLATQLTSWFGALQDDHTADGVSAKQRTLGPARHLHSFQVNGPGDTAAHLAAINSIYDHSNCRIETIFHI